MFIFDSLRPLRSRWQMFQFFSQRLPWHAQGANASARDSFPDHGTLPHGLCRLSLYTVYHTDP